MKICYYPGCTLKTKAKDLDVYARLSAEALGVEMEEIENWQCCGAVYPQASDEIASRLSAVRALENELTTLCVRCGVPPERMSLTGAKVDAGLSGVKLSLLDAMGMDILSGLMGVVLAVVGASLCGGGGVAMVSAGPAGMVAGAAAGILLALVGKSGMEKALVKAKLPLLVRRLVTDKAVKNGLSRQRDEIEKAIIKALADPANGFSARLCQSLSQTLGAQMERMAKDAEMSICA